jgi:hypothetical protein
MIKDYNNPKIFLNEVDGFCQTNGGQLKRKEDLNNIFAEAFNHNKANLLEDLAFTAKYLRGLMRVLEKGVQNPEVKSLEYVKSDYSLNVNKFTNQLKEILSESSDKTKEHFNKTYFELSHEGLRNLNELFSDLEWTKIYLNEQKRKQGTGN